MARAMAAARDFIATRHERRYEDICWCAASCANKCLPLPGRGRTQRLLAGGAGAVGRVIEGRGLRLAGTERERGWECGSGRDDDREKKMGQR